MDNTEPRSGETIAGRYYIEGIAGNGGMSTVYRAKDQLLYRTVALKRLSNIAPHNPKSSRRFLMEARAMAAIVHPSIVTLYDAFESDGHNYLVMEYVQGQTLREIIQAGPLLPSNAIAIALALLDALDYAHRHSIVHGDIKPENVLIDRAGRPKLADFGISRLTADTFHMATTVLGTPPYMSPEQLNGEPASGESDIYAVGLVLYEMLSGRLPFDGATPMAVAANRLVKDPLPLRQTAPSVSASVETVVMRAIARKRGSRYGNVAAFASALRGIQHGTASGPTRRVQPESETIRMPRDREPDSARPDPTAWQHRSAPTEDLKSAGNGGRRRGGAHARRTASNRSQNGYQGKADREEPQNRDEADPVDEGRRSFRIAMWSTILVLAAVGLAALALFLWWTVASFSNVDVKVIDLNGNSITKATVRLDNNAPVAVGPDARLQISKVRPGTHNISVSAAGFQSNSKGITSVAGQTLAVEIKLPSATPAPTSTPSRPNPTAPAATPTVTPNPNQVDTVRQFYAFIASKQFEQAHPMLTEANRQATRLEQWRTHFASTQSIQNLTARSGDQVNQVIVGYQAIDRIDCGFGSPLDFTRRFQGSVLLKEEYGKWRVWDTQAVDRSGGLLPPCPTPAARPTVPPTVPGSIRGTVTDSRGTLFSSATVRISGLLGLSDTVLTDASGRYEFLNLPSGQKYEIRVSAPSYADVTRQSRTVSPGQPTTEDFLLVLQ